MGPYNCIGGSGRLRLYNSTVPIDLRSDTVTKPGPGMRQAMANAQVGDDVFLDDPTLNQLEERIAGMLGFEAALFVPSGTMGNQLCLRTHSEPGDSLIAHEQSHILFYETGAPCALSGLQPRVIASCDGTFSPAEVEKLVLPENIHHSRNKILALENTHNRCGGSVWPLAKYREVVDFGNATGLKVHLDGARLWNACAATSTKLTDWTAGLSSISVCFSKALGAPIGSALAGTRMFVERARFFRKMFGGQMRQVGVLAAAVLYALDHNLPKLPEDHEKAKLLAELAANAKHATVVTPQSNILMVDLAQGVDPQKVAQTLHDNYDVWLIAIGPQRIRLVTHLDVSLDDCRQAGEALQKVLETYFS